MGDVVCIEVALRLDSAGEQETLKEEVRGLGGRVRDPPSLTDEMQNSGGGYSGSFIMSYCDSRVTLTPRKVGILKQSSDAIYRIVVRFAMNVGGSVGVVAGSLSLAIVIAFVSHLPFHTKWQARHCLVRHCIYTTYSDM